MNCLPLLYGQRGLMAGLVNKSSDSCTMHLETSPLLRGWSDGNVRGQDSLE